MLRHTLALLALLAGGCVAEPTPSPEPEAAPKAPEATYTIRTSAVTWRSDAGGTRVEGTVNVEGPGRVATLALKVELYDATGQRIARESAWMRNPAAMPAPFEAWTYQLDAKRVARVEVVGAELSVDDGGARPLRPHARLVR